MLQYLLRRLVTLMITLVGIMVEQGLLPDWVGSHAVQQNRDLKDGKINAYWVQVNNNVQAAANLMEETLPGYRNPANSAETWSGRGKQPGWFKLALTRGQQPEDLRN